MHDGRAQLAEQRRSKPRIQPDGVTRRLAQRHELHVVALNASTELGRDLGQCHHGVAVRRLRHVVDQVDDPVLQSAGVEPEEQMHHQGRTLGWRRGATAASREHGHRSTTQVRRKGLHRRTSARADGDCRARPRNTAGLQCPGDHAAEARVDSTRSQQPRSELLHPVAAEQQRSCGSAPWRREVGPEIDGRNDPKAGQPARCGAPPSHLATAGPPHQRWLADCRSNASNAAQIGLRKRLEGGVAASRSRCRYTARSPPHRRLPGQQRHCGCHFAAASL